MQHKTATLLSDYYGRLFIAARCADLIDAGEYGGQGPIRLQVEVGRYPLWDDLVEVHRSQDSVETIHGWQVKRQRTGLDKQAMRDQLQALLDSPLDRGYLALHNLEDVKKVGSLQSLSDLCNRVRQPNLDLCEALRGMPATQRKWLEFARTELKLPDEETVLRLFQRLSVEQVGTEERLRALACKDLRRWYEDPELVLAKLMDFLAKHPDEAVIIDYPYLRDHVLRGHTPTQRRGKTFTALRERYLQEILSQHKRLPLLKSITPLEGIRLADVFVPPALQQDRTPDLSFEEELGEETAQERRGPFPGHESWQRQLRHERTRVLPSSRVDLIDWLRAPHTLPTKTLLIEGPVGSGKSMMLEHLRYTLAQEALRTLEAPLPILFDAQDLSTGESLSAFRRRAPGVDDEQLLHQEGQQRIYLVDGLDEVAPRDLRRVSEVIDRLNGQGGTRALVLTGRPASAEFPVPPATPRLRLSSWTERDIERFLEKWRRKAPEQVDALGDAWRHEPMRSVLSNPLTATFSLLLVEERPEALRSRSALFEGICEKLFQDWSQARASQGHAEQRVWGDVSQVLQKLALEVLSDGQETLSKQLLEKRLRRMEPDRSREWMQAASVQFGLLFRQGDGSYRFVLRGLAEFLAGQALWREGSQRIHKEVQERWAEEPIRHAINIAATQDEPATALQLIQQIIPSGTRRTHTHKEFIGSVRATFVAARAAGDLGAAAQPIAQQLAAPLLHFLLVSTSTWIPARTAAEIRQLAQLESPCWEALFPRLQAKLSERKELATWFTGQPMDRGWSWWLSHLCVAEPRARTVITARLAHWVDEAEVREALICQLFDDTGGRFLEPVAPTEAGLALRQATRDPDFKQQRQPLLTFLLSENDQLAAGGAALALKPTEAPPQLLAKALRNLAGGYGCPAEVLNELAASPEGRAALDLEWEDWATNARDIDFERLSLPPPAQPSERMPVSEFSLSYALKAMGPALARMSPEERRALRWREEGSAFVATLVEEALTLPEGILSILTESSDATVFTFHAQLTLQEAVVRHPKLAHALLARWDRDQHGEAAFKYPGIALEGLVAAGDEGAARVFAAWIVPVTKLFFKAPGPALPFSARTLRHPIVRPVAHQLARDLLKTHTEGWLDEKGERMYLWMGTLSGALEALHPAWEGDAEMEAALVQSAITHDDFHFLHVQRVFRAQTCPAPLRESLLERLRRMLENTKDEHIHLLPALLSCAEQSDLIPPLRAQLEACVQRDSRESYEAAARLLSVYNLTEAKALSAHVAKRWPEHWSPGFNSPSGLSRLAAVEPRSWYEQLHLMLEQYAFLMAMRNFPVFTLARALLPRLPPGDQHALMVRLARTAGRYEQPWLGESRLGIEPRRPADVFFELCFDSGVYP